MAIPHVKPEQEVTGQNEWGEDTFSPVTRGPAGRAVELYNLVDQSPFLDNEKQFLNNFVRLLTGFEPAGYKTTPRGDIVYEHGRPVKEDAAVDHVAETKALNKANAAKADKASKSSDNTSTKDGDKA